jgi:hypothetical protein
VPVRVGGCVDDGALLIVGDHNHRAGDDSSDHRAVDSGDDRDHQHLGNSGRDGAEQRSND